MLIALLTLMLLGGDSYDLTEFITEGQSNMAVAVEDLQRRQTAMDILAEMEQTMAADKADTAALIARTQAEFTKGKVWSAEELDALYAQSSAGTNYKTKQYVSLRR